MMDKELKNLFFAGHVEGISYLLLLFVAMPLKYVADKPMAVKIAGSIHGFLFVWFMYTIFIALTNKRINFKQSVIVFLASLIPFATFFLERLILGRKSA